MWENHLIGESSPYLLQHAHQPVEWYPWGEEAFRQAREKDRPVFLSIGYSTCHWCHVMARESFEDEQIAKLLNDSFIAVKVDREERPDVDSVYMAVCQAMTGSGGWPASLFLTPEKKPFFAGTYFPRDTQRGMPGLRQILSAIARRWADDRASLLSSAQEVQNALASERTVGVTAREDLRERAIGEFRRSYDEQYGGFGGAPKFPSPHNLLFLLDRFEKTKDETALKMAQTTLQAMARGGLYDQIGFGFCRYSTDRAFQIPHFEKMLYDNALLIMAYVRAYDDVGDEACLRIAEQTAAFVLRELVVPGGGFASAQDADSDGVEGRFYALRPEEVIEVLGRERGEEYNRCFGVTERGNFHGMSIPHLVGTQQQAAALEDCFVKLRTYREKRSRLHTDDKVLTSWNGLMIAALAQLARVTGKPQFLDAAKKAMRYLKTHMAQDDRLFVSSREERRGCAGFLDDYANTIYALLQLQQVTQEEEHLRWADRLCARVVQDFFDEKEGGFFLSGRENEALILRPKETYDGAIPSANAVMACVLTRLAQLEEDFAYKDVAKRQMEFMCAAAAQLPMAHSFFLLALSDELEPPDRVTVVQAQEDSLSSVLKRLPLQALVTVLKAPTAEFSLLDGRTTFYICTGKVCLPPTNDPTLPGRNEKGAFDDRRAVRNAAGR